MKNLLIILLLACSISFAQSLQEPSPLNPTQLEQALTQGSRRQWKSIQTKMIQDENSCFDGGMIYTFTKVGNQRFLTLQECQDSKWVINNYTWKIIQQEGENILVLSYLKQQGKNLIIYPIRIVPKDLGKPLSNGNQQLILTIRGATKAEPSQYLYFQ
ncbi:hypothetical protein [Spirosoma sp. KCTC 42546]|uniref:hypothetical protein n=1 Tax=Spirosoma sp. KCTC 42546 TaxID=2520506 RepID=UPI00143DDE32|nr:hypothetical protein [Spirosoma sp. KCTC 42546]